MKVSKERKEGRRAVKPTGRKKADRQGGRQVSQKASKLYRWTDRQSVSESFCPFMIYPSFRQSFLPPFRTSVS